VRPALLLAAAAALVATAASPARAEFVMCLGGQGATPPAGSVLPPRPRLAFYTDRHLRVPDKITATIGGSPVKLTKSSTSSPPFTILTIAIESDRTGELVVTYENHAPLRYTIKPIEMPKEVTGTIGRFQGGEISGAQSEEFDGLAIRLPEATPAIIAHVRHRPQDTALWLALDVALYTPPGSQRPMIRVGQFACDSNADLASLARGFELEVTVTLADGRTVPVTGLAKRMTLPAALPPQPRPKNQRPR
jgi:hypothetical protein